MFWFGVVVMFVSDCFRFFRSAAACVAAGLVVVLAASACAPTDESTSGSAVVVPDRVEPVVVDVVPEPSPAAVTVPVSDSVASIDDVTVDPDPVVDPTPVDPAPTTVPSTTTVAPDPTVEPAAVPVVTVEPTPTTAAPTVTVSPTPTTDPAEPPTVVEPTVTVAPVVTVPTTADPPTGTAPPVSGFPAPYTVPALDAPPDPGVTVVSVTHHDAVFVQNVLEFTFRWTLHLSNGDSVERSWAPDPGYEWGDPATIYTTQETWYWDSDPVYGPHPRAIAHVSRNGSVFNAVFSANAPPGGFPGLPPSGYMHDVVTLYLDWVPVSYEGPAGQILYLELWLAATAMTMQEQRALVETMSELEGTTSGSGYAGDPSERGYFLKEFLEETQPRWVCRNYYWTDCRRQV